MRFLSAMRSGSSIRSLAARQLSPVLSKTFNEAGTVTVSSSSSSSSPAPTAGLVNRLDSNPFFGRLGSFSVRNYRRTPVQSMSELDLQEEVAKIDMDPKKMLQAGDPNSMQAVIKDVMPVGYFLDLPTGRTGYLPADDLGFTGGLEILRRLFKEGQEITVRIVCRGGAGREIVSCKKPEFAPPSEQKTIEMMRLHFEWEKKNRMNPRRRHQYNNNNNH